MSLHSFVGRGPIALRNPETERWLSATPEGGLESTPGPGGRWCTEWKLERFIVEDAGDGLVGLKSQDTGRWIRLTDGGDADLQVRVRVRVGVSSLHGHHISLHPNLQQR